MKTTFKIWLIVFLTAIAVAVSAQVVVINHNFSSDSAFRPFTGSKPVYSVKIIGDVKLYSDSSLIRVVLIDANSNHYLIYEVYPLITRSNDFHVEGGCDETCYLNGIIPDSIRIDIISASLSLTSLAVDTNIVNNAEELQIQAKWRNDSVKMAIMNQQIRQNNMYWRAGRTEWVDNLFDFKEKIFGKKFNLTGFDYYIGGIFEFIHHRVPAETPDNYVAEFDWRKRHDSNIPGTPYFNNNGYGWITMPEGQVDNSCWLFTTTHIVSDFINVYSNHLFNYKPSKQEVLWCPSISCGNCQTGGSYSCALDYIQGSHVHLQQNCNLLNCYSHNPCGSICSQSEQIWFYSHYNVLIDSNNHIKNSLIRYGPLASGLNNLIVSPGHAMELVGYKTIHAGDTVYINLHDTIIIGSNSTLIGGTSWIFKNSAAASYEPWFLNYHGNVNTLFATERLVGPVYSSLSQNQNHIIKPLCKDEDGDGYYWWGVGPLTADCGCPPGVLEEDEDCNDHDATVGPYVTILNSSDSLKLYSCRPNNCVTSDSTIDITDSTVWTTVIHIHKNIIIHAGGILVVKGALFFTPGAKIVVQSGGLLILKGDSKNVPARLTSGCGQLWGGVELHGDPFLSQDSLPNQYASQNQGTIIIYNGIVENAVCGIQTFNSNAIHDDPGGAERIGYPSGGIIQAELATFKNNRTGVEIFPYRDNNKPNKSYFKACNFITSDSLYNNATPEYLLKLDGVNNVKILGTSFKNKYYRNNSLLPKYSVRGSGIYCYNSSMEIDSLLEISTLFGIDSLYKPDFEDLKYGIYAMNSAQGNSIVTLAKAQFHSNNFGSYFSGFREVNPLDIRRNNYFLTLNFGSDTIYCMYLDHCSGYKVTRNYFDASGVSDTVNKLGIIVNNSGARTNYIYNNGPFRQFTNALQGQNVNHGRYLPDGWDPGAVPLETGLHFVCNDFVLCKHDIIINQNLLVNYNGIDYYQRNCASVPLNQRPAGNAFTYDYMSLTNHKDIDNDKDVGNIQYSFHNSGPTGIRLEPFKQLISNPDKVFTTPMNGTVYSKNSSCPDTFYPELNLDELREGIKQADFKIDSLMNLLHLLTDNGSTDSLTSAVISGTPSQSYNIFQNLLTASPFLSDTVLKSSIINEEILPNAMLRDIMVANPQSAKSEDLLTTLDNRFNPMPDSLWAEILLGQDTIGAMERLEAELSGWIQNRDNYFNSLINLFLIEPAYSVTGDSLVSALQKDHNLNSKYNIISYYLITNNFSQASDILDNIPFDFPLKEDDQVICQDFGTLIPLFEQLVNDTTGYKLPDSIQCLALLDLAYHENLPGMYARNILINAGYLNYREPVILETTLKNSNTQHYYGRKGKLFSDIKVYPNPCKDYIIIQYSRENSGGNLYAEILDSKGILIGTYIFRKQSSQVVVPFTDFSPGIYFIRFSVNGAQKSVCRVIHI